MKPLAVTVGKPNLSRLSFLPQNLGFMCAISAIPKILECHFFLGALSWGHDHTWVEMVGDVQDKEGKDGNATGTCSPITCQYRLDIVDVCSGLKRCPTPRGQQHWRE